ncbi:hypothetical protein [Luteimonas sp. FCS-9]|uniref:hypothetical protein n=1 Tax=Luteimonas sp. FCS-9 TaxID=1547516 RepID=UPI000A629A77|nr:hypothetical protein [Luteimonas sp. FCS-9]
MKSRFEDLLEAHVVESFNLTDAMANDLAGESTDNATPTTIWAIAIITSAAEC